MLIMIDFVIGYRRLINDADITFMHCSFDDLDNILQFCAKWLSSLDGPTSASRLPDFNVFIHYKNIKATVCNPENSDPSNILRLITL